MQVSKTLSGTIRLEEKAVDRIASYGATTKISVYPSKIDTINYVIADFLSGTCGVDAWYGSKGEEEDSFLWIYGAPFLYACTGTSGGINIYGPYNGSRINSVASGATAAVTFLGAHNKDTNTVDYSFKAVFTGNPSNGFILRFMGMNSTSFAGYAGIRYMRAENIINGADAVVFGRYATYNATAVTGLNGIDLFGGYTPMNKESFSTSLMTFDPILHTKAVHMTSNDGAIPLVPINIGPYRVNGIFHRPAYYNLPPTVATSVEILPEITIGGRSFLITTSDSQATNGFNMGLIETT